MSDTVNQIIGKRQIQETLSLHCVDDLETYTYDDYQKTTDLAVRLIADKPGVLCIGSFGHVGTPGVSDIDIFVIVEDEHYVSSCSVINQCVRTIPNASFFFPHKIFVFPQSLVPLKKILFFENTTDTDIVLWGDATILSCQQIPTLQSIAVSSAIWSSTVWRIVWNLHKGQRGLRSLLLLLQNIVQQIAQDLHVLEDEIGKETLQKWGKVMREKVLMAPSSTKNEIVSQILQEAITLWLQVEWRMQEWWNQANLSSGNPLLSVDDHDICFSDTPQAPAAGMCVLPSYYMHILNTESVIQNPWKQALDLRRSSEHIVMQFARAHDLEEHALFLHGNQGIFPTPFNLLFDYTKTQSAQYDDCASLYAQQRDQYYAKYPNDSRKALLEHLDTPIEGKRILDVGCGTGDDVQHMIDLGADAYGIDESGSMIDLVAERYPTLKNVRIGNARDTGFSDNFFDMITSKYALHYTNDLQKVFLEMKRILRPGGMMLCVEVHPLYTLFMKEKRIYQSGDITQVPLFQGALTVEAPSHTFSDYLDETILQSFDVQSFREGPLCSLDAETSVPLFFVLKLRKKD